MKKKQRWRHSLPVIREHLLRISLTIILLNLFSNSASAGAVALSQLVSIKATNSPIKQVFSELKKQTGTYFMYNEKTVNEDAKVSINATRAPLNSVLNDICDQTNLSYELVEDYVLITPSHKIMTISAPVIQKKSVTIQGIIVDEDGNPLPGVSVSVKGTTIGTASNIDGKFGIKAPQPGNMVVFSFVGMETQQMVAEKDIQNLRIVLKSNAKKLEDVVITGYQTISKERAAGSFGVITSESMDKKLQPTIMSKLEGMVAGFTSYKNSYIIRGTSTIRGDSKPLIIVDNAPFEGDINTINPSDISNVTILKDATAASIYGARSANGVIVITTRNGNTGPTSVSYTGGLHITPLPDKSYLNLMSSKELVQFQTELFDLSHNTTYDTDRAMNEVYKLLYDREANLLTEKELQAKLDVYRSSNRYDQVLKEFVRKQRIEQQHNIAIRGGTDVYKYSYSLSYKKTNPYEKNQSSDLISFNLKNSINFYKWMQVDVGLLGNSATSDYDNGISGYSLLNGGGASYYMLRDKDGNPVQWYTDKSQEEIDRLKSIGLKDESYYPVSEMDKAHRSAKSRYLNFNVNVKFKLFEGLTLDIKGQRETTDEYQKDLLSKDSYSMKSLYNNATTLPDAVTGQRTHYIPDGGMLTRTNSNSSSYTFRTQLSYGSIINDKHRISAILGAERRQVQYKSDGFCQFGYDDFNLGNKFVDAQTLLELNQRGIKTEALNNIFTYSVPTPGNVDKEDRYVSFYGNASYTFNNRLSATTSIRMDQSNLFGTDPKYQYRPLWSVGAQYIALENKPGLLNRLAFRLTYGINGNIPKSGGPYLISKVESTPAYYTGEYYAYISTPPNSGLRWEKTNTTNFGIDFSTLKGRLSGSLEIYNKQTNDLLGDRAADETLGWSNLLVNYGKMYNRGIEVNIQSENLHIGDFMWNTNLTFSYNKNKLTTIENPASSPYSYYSGPQYREGYPMGAMFSSRYAGLNELGQPTSFTKDGKVVNKEGELVKDDLVYSGTSVPPYAGSLTNGFSYKGIDFSFMLVYYGGHVFRDVAAGYLISYYPILNYQSNIDKNFMNYWKQPGDEKNPDTNPAFAYNKYNSDVQNLWRSADKHIQKGDFIRLRDLTLGYSLPVRWIGKIALKSARVSFQARNLWYWAANDKNLDPETWSGTSLSPSRGSKTTPTYSFGLSLNF